MTEREAQFDAQFPSYSGDTGYERGYRRVWDAAWQAATAAERERAAKVCEEIADKHMASGRYVSVVADHSVRAGGQVDAAEQCAAAIRSAEEK